MAREGYLIIDSDMHFNEPGDLWARYLDEPYRANPPQFFGGLKRIVRNVALIAGSNDRRVLLRTGAHETRSFGNR